MKARIIMTLFHLLHISATTVLIPSLRSADSQIFFIYWASVCISFVLYFVTSLADPGKISNLKPVSTTKPEVTFHHQQSSLGSILTAASGLHKLNKGEKDCKEHPEGEAFDGNPISESLHQHDSQVDSVSINLDIIQDEEEPSLTNHLQVPENKVQEKQTEDISQEPHSLKLESPSADVSVNLGPRVAEGKEKLPENFDYVYCTACFNDQPLRARHCKQCGVCVALFDHHCPFVDNCIGEKNKFFFFWFVIFQTFECFFTFAVLVSRISRKEEVLEFWNENYLLILASFCPFLIGTLLAFLWVYHFYLACAGVTTFEIIKWKEIYYLENKERSPFSKGILGNLVYFCRPCKEITYWRM